jgi:predicted peptidase
VEPLPRRPEPPGDFIRELILEVHADRSRVYLTGISVGAYAVWENAKQDPELFAALAPVSGGISESEESEPPSHPAWVVIGERDLEHVRAWPDKVSSVRERGANIRLTVEPGGKHENPFWDNVYAWPELYEWLLTHSRRTR